MKISADILNRCWFLAGPTACGKTEVGLLLAERLHAEIVSLDSMALYRGMDIGTAKPTPGQRRRVPHHLVDVIDPHEEYSVADYVQAAETACREILAHGRRPLFVGGTGLYLRSLLRGVHSGPPPDWDLRRRLQAEADVHGSKALHERLRQRDPQAAVKLHPNDERRIIRALEVVETTGQPLSAQQRHPPLPESERPQHVYWLNPPRDWLYERINFRVQTMVARGLAEEVRQLLNAAPPPGRTARQAIGYKEVIEHVTQGVPLDETIQRIQTRTRQFAKRQYTWFRNLEECRGIDMTGKEPSQELVERILEISDRLTSVDH